MFSTFQKTFREVLSTHRRQAARMHVHGVGSSPDEDEPSVDEEVAEVGGERVEERVAPLMSLRSSRKQFRHLASNTCPTKSEQIVSLTPGRFQQSPYTWKRWKPRRAEEDIQ